MSEYSPLPKVAKVSLGLNCSFMQGTPVSLLAGLDPLSV
jgi:hypothetical protein